MAAKAWSLQQKAVEEVFFQNDVVSLCLLVNRRARTMRVVDFRAGPSHAKRAFVHALAQREGVEKVYTLVERDEVQTWQKLGFTKEGNIPGFYKRSDAFLLGCPVDPAPARSGATGAAGTTGTAGATQRRHAEEIPLNSETRLAVAEPALDPPALTAGQERMERTIAAAKRLAKDGAERGPTHAKVADLDEADARKAVAAAMRSARALTTFEPFGRDVERRYFSVTMRGGFELVASTESQACFGNAYLELLTSPRTEAEKTGTVAALRGLCDRLMSEGVVSCFSLAPSDDVRLATAFLQNGFRRTGLLGDHMVVGGLRKDAILWSRKLSNPQDE
jgi:hypothetical protein